MSIESISQGNYILQGTVATSAGIVGDGSQQNPLRADETVLWSGTKNSIGETIQLSESLNNFNKIAILHCDRYNIDGSVSYFERTTSADFEWLTFPCVSQFMYSNTVYNRGSELSANANKDVLTIVGSFNYAVNTAGPYGYSIITADSALGQRNIYKVIGINRTAGNS